jgi:signal transduction histidine kinase
LRGDALRLLAEEQSALRRVATLVAVGTSPEKVFAAVVEEIGRLLPVDFADMGRYESDGAIAFVAAWGNGGGYSPVGARWALGGKNLSTIVFETGRPARIESYADASGRLGVAGRERGFRSAVGTPIIVEGRLWGVVIAGSSRAEPMPADTEARLASFTELLATAIANAESCAGLTRLAEEQAALRRVATLVAIGGAPREVFAAATEEVGKVLPVDFAAMGCYEPDRTISILASWGTSADVFSVGSRWILEGENLATIVADTGRPARMDNFLDASGPLGLAAREAGVRSAVGTPIVVQGRFWGVMIAGSSRGRPLLPGIEARLGSFTELLATAIANAESRAHLARLADEQAALRRVATRVALGAPPEAVFAAVAAEVQRLLRVDVAGMGRYEPDGTLTVVASRGGEGPIIPVGSRHGLGGQTINTIVFETGRPARVDVDASDWSAAAIGEADFRSSVGTPIIVDGRLWGLMGVGSRVEPLPTDTEERLSQFTELLATAIANAENRAALTASRARIVAAADDARRRIERDLHDRAQQRLVTLGLELREAQATVPPQLKELEAKLSHVVEGLAGVFDEVRDISHGVHPAILSEGGLEPALRALARRSPVPVELDAQAKCRLPEQIEVAAYYVASEALTNAAKHAHASVVRVELEAGESSVRLAIRDDGIGGADPGHGSGLVGLSDRIEALGGILQLTSPAGTGTTLLAEIPIPTRN